MMYFWRLTQHLDARLIDFDVSAADSLAKWGKKSFREGQEPGDGPWILKIFRKVPEWVGNIIDGQFECTEAEMVEWARKKVNRLIQQRLTVEPAIFKR